MKKLLIGVLWLTILSSCQNVTKLTKGVYTIDEISFQGRDIKQEVYVNMIFLKRNNKCRLPTTRDFSDLKVTEDTGEWKITKNSLGTFQLTIESGNKIFSGMHDVCFFKDFENKLVKLRIHSNNLEMVCSKTLVNFDKEASMFDEFLCSDIALK